MNALPATPSRHRFRYEQRRSPMSGQYWRKVALGALLSACAAVAVAAPAFKAGVFDPPRQAPDFSLTGDQRTGADTQSLSR